jgi:hypothetical protein
MSAIASIWCNYRLPESIDGRRRPEGHKRP